MIKVLEFLGVIYSFKLITIGCEYASDYIFDRIGYEGCMTVNMALLIWATLGIVAAYFYWR